MQAGCAMPYGSRFAPQTPHRFVGGVWIAEFEKRKKKNIVLFCWGVLDVAEFGGVMFGLYVEDQWAPSGCWVQIACVMHQYNRCFF